MYKPAKTKQQTITHINRSLCLLCSFMFLTACTSYQRMPEPTSHGAYGNRSTAKKGTQKPYTVNGKRYEPLATHEGYQQSGLASIYGAEFHGRKTSSGEIFDMNAMTAAHKTLPLGVHVRVQHKKSKREVIVRINDRGPFVSSRIIDLSREAASRLGILQEGVAPVQVTALGYMESTTDGSTRYNAPQNYDNGSYSIQAGAFSIRANATRYADELRLKFGTADIQTSELSGRTYYRVRSGRYNSLKAAQAGIRLYEKEGIRGCYVVAVD